MRANTKNPQFNSCWNHLVQMHGVEKDGDLVCVRIGQMPKFLPRNPELWSDWLQSLITTLQIGVRNGWVTMHLDSDGRPHCISTHRELLGGE